MANTARTQAALANSPHFLTRVKTALAKVAWQVLDESPGVADHIQRAAYARQVIQNVDGAAGVLVGSIVTRTNVFAFTTSYDFEIGAVVSAAGDPDIESQISTDWNHLSGL